MTFVPEPHLSWPGWQAEGQTEVAGASHIDRGYEDLVGKLVGIGATVSRS